MLFDFCSEIVDMSFSLKLQIHISYQYIVFNNPMEHYCFSQVYNQLYLMVPEKKLILMFLLFLVTAAILNS